jgi:hypothetical protein
MTRKTCHHGYLINALLEAGVDILAKDSVSVLSLHEVIKKKDVSQAQGEPLRQLVETAWTYVQFALTSPTHFKITFSGTVEKQEDYPAYVDISKKSFGLVVQIVEACQAAGVLRAGPSDVMVVSVWSLVHGFVCLYLEEQISHTLLEQMTLREALTFSLNQITCVETNSGMFPLEQPL